MLWCDHSTVYSRDRGSNPGRHLLSYTIYCLSRWWFYRSYITPFKLRKIASARHWPSDNMPSTHEVQPPTSHRIPSAGCVHFSGVFAGPGTSVSSVRPCHNTRTSECSARLSYPYPNICKFCKSLHIRTPNFCEFCTPCVKIVGVRARHLLYPPGTREFCTPVPQYSELVLVL